MASPHRRVTARPPHRSSTPSVVRLRSVSRAATPDERWPAIGVVFEHGDLAATLGEEEAFPVDTVLWRGATDAEQPVILDALRRAGRRVIDGGANRLQMAA